MDRELKWGAVGRASYAGHYSYNLIYSPDLNQLKPNIIGFNALTETPALRKQNLLYPNFNEVDRFVDALASYLSLSQDVQPNAISWRSIS